MQIKKVTLKNAKKKVTILYLKEQQMMYMKTIINGILPQ